jgi:hypothetical protein
VTNKLLLEGGFTFYNERWLFGPKPDNINGYGADAVVSKNDTATGYLYGAAANANPFVAAGNHQYNIRAAVNYVTGSHAFKFGMTDLWGTRAYQYDLNQAQAWTFSNGIPTTISQYARPLFDKERVNAALGLYAQDRWTVDRLTVNYGIRFDYHNAMVPAQDLPAITFVPARHYDEIKNVPNWTDLSPRVGATYDLFGNAKTVVRANYAKYVASESTNMATLNNRVNTSVNSANRSWSDANGNFVPDCDLTNPGAQDRRGSGGDNCGALDSPLGSLAIAAAYDKAITSGFGVRPNDQEISLGVQQEVIPNVSLDFQFTRHWFGNFVASQDTIRTPAAYDPFCVTPNTSTNNGFSLPSGNDQICGFYNRNPNPAFTPTFLNVTKASDFGDVSDVYTGYDVNLNARLPRGGSASGGFSIGHEITDICDVIGQASVTYAAVAGVLSSTAGTIASTTGYPSTLYCRVEPPYQADIKGLVSYPLPWWGLRASATLQNRPGPQILANYTINAANVASQTTLGRAVTGGTQTTQLIAPGTVYGDRFTQVDVRFGKGFRIGRGRVQASLDIYNLMNSSAVLAQNNTFGTSWRTPTSILQGRLVKVGGQIDF